MSSRFNGPSAMNTPVVRFDDLPSARTLVEGLSFPESMRVWRGEIYFSDVSAVRAVDHYGNLRLVADLPAPLTIGIAVSDNGTVYAAGSLDRTIYRLDGGQARVALDLSSATEAPINEFVLLPNGGMLVASMGWNPLVEGFDVRRTARLLLVSPDGTVCPTGPELLFANGMVLLGNGRALWVAESFAGQLRRLRLDEDGQVVGEFVVSLHDRGLQPDGLAIDTCGNIWFGEMNHGAAVRVGSQGETEIYLDVNDPRAPACVSYDVDGREWLAISTTVDGPGQGDPAARTARIIAAPLDEIEAAALPLAARQRTGRRG